MMLLETSGRCVLEWALLIKGEAYIPDIEPDTHATKKSWRKRQYQANTKKLRIWIFTPIHVRHLTSNKFLFKTLFFNKTRRIVGCMTFILAPNLYIEIKTKHLNIVYTLYVLHQYMNIKGTGQTMCNSTYGLDLDSMQGHCFCGCWAWYD